jgi:hypothetical protein
MPSDVKRWCKRIEYLYLADKYAEKHLLTVSKHFDQTAKLLSRITYSVGEH